MNLIRPLSPTVCTVCKIALLAVLMVGAGCSTEPEPPKDPGFWPQFRGPDGQGLAPESKLPHHWTPEKGIRWRTLLPDGISQPIVSGDRIFVAASHASSVVVFDGNDNRLATIPLPPDPLSTLAAELPSALEDVVMRAIAKAPGDRPARIADVTAALEAD